MNVYADMYDISDGTDHLTADKIGNDAMTTFNHYSNNIDEGRKGGIRFIFQRPKQRLNILMASWDQAKFAKQVCGKN